MEKICHKATLPKKFPIQNRLTQAILKKIAGENDENGQYSGSRYDDGNVPNVNWYNPGHANGNLRSRQKFY